MLLADVPIPIVGVDFLHLYHLMVDPAANRLIDTVSIQVLTPPHHLPQLSLLSMYPSDFQQQFCRRPTLSCHGSWWQFHHPSVGGSLTALAAAGVKVPRLSLEANPLLLMEFWRPRPMATIKMLPLPLTAIPGPNRLHQLVSQFIFLRWLI